jgi:hypothetical protein
VGVTPFQVGYRASGKYSVHTIFLAVAVEYSHRHDYPPSSRRQKSYRYSINCLNTHPPIRARPAQRTGVSISGSIPSTCWLGRSHMGSFPGCLKRWHVQLATQPPPTSNPADETLRPHLAAVFSPPPPSPRRLFFERAFYCDTNMKSWWCRTRMGNSPLLPQRRPTSAPLSPSPAPPFTATIPTETL